MSRNPKNSSRSSPKPRNIQELVNTLNESELHALHHCIVERLRFLQQQRVQEDMMQFRLGDVVRFTNNDGQEVIGVLIRLNRKSVSVHTEAGSRWTVSPQFLTLVKRHSITVDAEQRAQLPIELSDYLKKLAK